MEYPINQSAWRRGWNDTKKTWTSWQFYVLDAVVAVMIGGVFEWYWGLVVVVFGMLCAWLGATVSAPYRQRDEVRTLLLAKPKPIPLPNRGELIKALSEVQQTSGVLLMAQENIDNMKARSPYLVDTVALNFRDDAQAKYDQAMSKLQAEMMVAGKPFESILSEPVIYIGTQVLKKVTKPTIVGVNPQQVRSRSALNIFVRIIVKVSNAIRKIDELSGQAPDKGGSQT